MSKFGNITETNLNEDFCQNECPVNNNCDVLKCDPSFCEACPDMKCACPQCPLNKEEE